MSSETWKFPNWEAAHAEYVKVGQEFAEAEKYLEISEAVGEELYADAVLSVTGTVEEKKAKARRDPTYKQWKRDHAEKRRLKNSLKQRLNAGDIWFRMVQTTSANIRAERTFQ
jgi:hypothetical protein